MIRSGRAGLLEARRPWPIEPALLSTTVNFSEGAADPSRAATVLIAEDHPDSREALRALLEAGGYRVHLAADGMEVVEKAGRVDPDLILMDIMMPGMDGLEATRRLREDPAFEEVPIVALTAMAGARERALAAGCDDCMAKPIDVSSFFRNIHGWLQRGRTGSSAPPSSSRAC